MITEFTNKSIVFPKGYFFRHSSVKKGVEISASQIQEVNLNTFPPSFVINNNEVIFVKAEYREQLENFAQQNNIPIINRPEIWEMLCEPFLDTEFDTEHMRKTIDTLIENGVPEEETNSIREKIKNVMLLNNSLAWEWNHLGQFDYLQWSLMHNKEKYRWTMEIALRNFKTKKY